MHPLLTRRGRLGPYLAAWAPLAALLAGLFRVAARVGWWEAFVLAVPVALVYAFVCLAAWYPCRAVPLSVSRLPKIVLAQLLGGALSSMLLLFLTDTWVVFLEQLPPFAGLGERFKPLVAPLLIAGVLLYLIVAFMHYLVVAFEEARRAEARELQLSLLAREAELRALKAQINPHFLFNALNSVSALTSTDPAGARQMCNLLAEFLRDSLRVATREQITLAEELALVEKYLAVEKVRFGPRLSFECDVEAAASLVALPPLLLQPLAENAVKHGIAHLLRGGSVGIGAGVRDGLLRISLSNPCDPDTRPSGGEGVGLANVKARLDAFSRGRGQLVFDRRADTFRVDLLLPVEGLGA
jgi:two-component system, LytTR family, sensor histidine kinase AlgZ